jgi:hypothetical protein
MARFRATIQGNRGEASRLGSASSGIVTRTNGWDAGVDVIGRTEGDNDLFSIRATGGSGGSRQPVEIAVVDNHGIRQTVDVVLFTDEFNSVRIGGVFRSGVDATEHRNLINSRAGFNAWITSVDVS